MIVCLCHRVSDRDIRRAVQEGVRDFSQLQDDTGVARGCAACHDCARDVFDQACQRAGGCGAESCVRPMQWLPA